MHTYLRYSSSAGLSPISHVIPLTEYAMYTELAIEIRQLIAIRITGYLDMLFWPGNILYRDIAQGLSPEVGIHCIAPSIQDIDRAVGTAEAEGYNTIVVYT